LPPAAHGSPPPGVEIDTLVKRFGAVTAVAGVSLAVQRGELFALLGPSGCGKTTLLRLIAGLEEPTTGRLFIGGAEMTATPAHRRPVNMVFQHYALFPHLTVAENVAFGLRYLADRRGRRDGDGERVAAALDLVRLPGYERRYPHELSGGQRQRVALARALALEPQVLLLDEPLGALDQELRQAMQLELKRLQRALGITFILVTHDQQEALALSDRVAVMSQGRIEQVGTPRELFERPATAFVAGFTGAANLWDAEVVIVTAADDTGSVRLRLAGGIEAELPLPPFTLHPGDAVKVVVRPEKLRLHGPNEDGDTTVPVTLEDSVYQGAHTLWLVHDAAGHRFSVLQPSAAPPADLPPGAPAVLRWHPHDAVVVRP
jgi:spermidine/putrescine transport system ATP-binding protein